MFLKPLDLLSDPINLTFQSTKFKKTNFGGLLTLFVLAFTNYCVFYFGLDIIYKEKPDSKLYERFINESRIYLNDMPLVFLFSTVDTKKPRDIDKYLTFLVRYYQIGLSTDTGYSSFIHYLYVDKCTNEDYKTFPDYFLKELSINDELYCLNPRKIRYANGTINQNDTNLYFMNEIAATPSHILRLEVHECNPILHNKECFPEEKRNKLLNDFYMLHYFPDYYIDTSDYIQPHKPYVYSFPQTLSKGMTKEVKIKIKSVEITTDSGYLMEDLNSLNVFQFKDIQRDNKLGTNYLYSLSFGSTRIQDVHFRKYLKVPDLIAQIGGLIKFLFIIGGLLCRYYSQCTFISDLSNLIFVKYEEKEKDSKIQDVRVHRFSKIKDPHASEVQLQISKIHQLSNVSNVFNTTRAPLKTSFCDRLRAKCRRNSNYDNEVYNNIEKFINNHLDILYITKQLIKIDKFIELFTKDLDLKRCLEQKLNYDTYDFKNMNEDLIEDPDLRAKQLEYQGKLNLIIN